MFYNQIIDAGHIKPHTDGTDSVDNNIHSHSGRFDIKKNSLIPKTHGVKTENKCTQSCFIARKVFDLTVSDLVHTALPLHMHACMNTHARTHTHT